MTSSLVRCASRSPAPRPQAQAPSGRTLRRSRPAPSHGQAAPSPTPASQDRHARRSATAAFSHSPQLGKLKALIWTATPDSGTVRWMAWKFSAFASRTGLSSSSTRASPRLARAVHSISACRCRRRCRWRHRSRYCRNWRERWSQSGPGWRPVRRRRRPATAPARQKKARAGPRGRGPGIVERRVEISPGRGGRELVMVTGSTSVVSTPSLRATTGRTSISIFAAASA